MRKLGRKDEEEAINALPSALSVGEFADVEIIDAYDYDLKGRLI